MSKHYQYLGEYLGDALLPTSIISGGKPHQSRSAVLFCVYQGSRKQKAQNTAAALFGQGGATGYAEGHTFHET